MNQFIEEIFKHPWISNYPVISGITILVVLTVTFGKNILELWDYVKKRRIKTLEEILNSSYLERGTKKLLIEILSQHYFKLGVGLYLSSKYQNQLLKIYRKHNSPVAFVHFKRVINNIKYRNDRIYSIRLYMLEEIVGCLIASLGILSFCLFILIIITNKAKDIYELMVMLLMMAFFFVIGVLAIFKPYYKYKSCVFVNRQIGNSPATCIYEKALKYKYNWPRFMHYLIIMLPVASLINGWVVSINLVYLVIFIIMYSVKKWRPIPEKKLW